MKTRLHENATLARRSRDVGLRNLCKQIPACLKITSPMTQAKTMHSTSAKTELLALKSQNLARNFLHCSVLFWLQLQVPHHISSIRIFAWISSWEMRHVTLIVVTVNYHSRKLRCGKKCISAKGRNGCQEHIFLSFSACHIRD